MCVYSSWRVQHVYRNAEGGSHHEVNQLVVADLGSRQVQLALHHRVAVIVKHTKQQGDDLQDQPWLSLVA